MGTKTVNDLQVEVFRGVMPSDAIRPDEWAREAQEYLAIGLTTLEVAARQRSVAPSEFGTRLSADALAVWQWRYPTVYCTIAFPNRSSAQVSRPWGELAWPIPSEVRELIRTVWGAYDRLEIWTPELAPAPRLGPSPILLGVRGEEYWLLARWAEALEPFEDIRRRALAPAGRQAMRVRRLYINGDPADVVSLSLGILSILALCAEIFFFGHVMPGIISAPAMGLGAVLGWRIYLRLPVTVRRACRYAGWVLRD